MSKNDLTKAFDQLDIRKRNKDKPLPGILGFMLNGKKTVEVPTRPGFVFVRLRNTTNELIQAYNGEVSPVYDLPVLVDRDDVDKSRYRVIGRDLGAYQNWGSSSGYLPRHGSTHSFSPDTSGGGDIVFVYGRQMMPLAVMQSGSSGAGCAYIESGIFYQAGKWVYAGNTGTANLLPAKPSAGNARMLLVYLDENGNPGIATGTVFSESLTGTASIIPYLPNITSNYYIPLAGIRLTNDTTAILWDNIYDVRPWIVGDGFIPTGSFSSNNSSYVTMGSSSGLTAERVLTAGDGISIIDGGANSTVTIAVTNTGTSVSQSSPTYPAIYDDNTFKATGTAIHFNDNLVVAVTGTSVWIDGQAGGGASTPTYPAIYDDGTFKSTGTAIHFNDNLSVVSTGTSVWIDAVGVTGTAGTPGASGPPGSNTVLIYDNDTFKTTGTSIHYNDNLSVITSGSSAWINGQAGGGGSNILIYDDNVFKVTGTAIVFGTNIDVAVTGTVAFVNSNYGKVLISEQTPVGTGTVTWSSIPSGYKDLELAWTVRGTQAATLVLMLCYFNNDATAANYRRTMDGAYAASSALHEATDDARIAIVSAGTAPTGSAGRGKAYIVNYTDTTFNKNFSSSGGARVATSADQLYNYTCTVEWENAAAINRIDLVLSAGNFDTGSTLRLYGVY